MDGATQPVVWLFLQTCYSVLTKHWSIFQSGDSSQWKYQSILSWSTSIEVGKSIVSYMPAAQASVKQLAKVLCRYMTTESKHSSQGSIVMEASLFIHTMSLSDADCKSSGWLDMLVHSIYLPCVISLVSGCSSYLCHL